MFSFVITVQEIHVKQGFRNILPRWEVVFSYRIAMWNVGLDLNIVTVCFESHLVVCLLNVDI